ncbi:MAG: LLM class flavin-dependent oxidoreductase [Dehalococcoidia bacterium]|nr:LLM class flavin-dependent oxidoreductase [Dehalococcoidia bacterium]
MAPTVGVAIQATEAREFVAQVQQAERAGVPVAWCTIGGAAGGDTLTAYAAALAGTSTIRLGTAIVPTWPRHPLVMASQAMTIEQLAPGRLRLGVGPSHEASMTRSYGAAFHHPLTELREYLTVLRTLSTTGKVDFVGEHITAVATWRAPVPFELLASALRPKSFELCGQLADGAISWMCPKHYLVTQGLPALAAGAKRGNRATPPLIAHVPVAVSSDRAAVRDLARKQLGSYMTSPFYLAMFREAGFPTANEGYSDEMLDDLVVSGTQAEITERLRGYIIDGCGEVLAHPLLDPADRAGSIASAFAAVAAAHKAIAG